MFQKEKGVIDMQEEVFDLRRRLDRYEGRHEITVYEDHDRCKFNVNGHDVYSEPRSTTISHSELLRRICTEIGLELKYVPGSSEYVDVVKATKTRK